MAYYTWRLPHWQPENTPLFLTWSLQGAIPRNRYPPPGHAAAGEAFVFIDRFLDQAKHGPTWMIRQEIAHLIAGALRFSADNLSQFALHAFVVMPNHVHMLVTPQIPASKFMQTLKGFTAREANRMLAREGQRFWQHESYDHWVRGDEQFGRIVRYIEENPVRAGLAASPEEYRWSSAYRGAS
jgi:REP element-mobilizing transposase RayT